MRTAILTCLHSCLLLVLLCGCNLPAPKSTPTTTLPLPGVTSTIESTPLTPSITPQLTRTQAPQVTPTTLVLPTQRVSPSSTPQVLETLSPGLLPQSLYTLANLHGVTQIWRVDPQGNRTQVTYETEDVTGFDVALSDGVLAYTTSNQLYVTRQGGYVPGLVVDGAQVSNPVFSKDGSQLAYAMDGIKVYNRDRGEWSNVIFNSGKDTNYVRRYVPVRWSQDGQRILVNVQLYECNVYELVTLNGTETQSFGFGGIGAFNWGREAYNLLYAEPVVGGMCGNEPGLWRIDARNGQKTVLINREENGRIQLVGFPVVNPEGRMQYFLGQVPNEQDIWNAPLRMVSAQMDGVTDRQSLRTDEFVFYDDYDIGEVLWAPDASFAIVTAVTDQPPRKDAWLLKTDGSPAVFLGYLGYNLRWGTP
jgi:hypothetical protein